ncbi:MAG: carboxypeptidase-like regulatory domain-containing protein [Myxococcaceae bacterium]
MRRALIAAGVLALIAAPVLLWWLLRPSDLTPPSPSAAAASSAPKRAAAPSSRTREAPVEAGEELDAGSGIYGLVVDENGDPVPNAHVQLDGYTDHSTDAEGRYPVGDNDPAELHVIAYDAAHGFGVADGTNAAPPTVKLAPLGTARVRVTVGGKPAVAAEINLCQARDKAGKPLSRRPPCDVTLNTGPDGVLEARGLTGGDWLVGVNAPEAGEMANTTVGLEGSGVRELSFDLREARRFEGLVTDPNGKPLHCARVSVTERAAQARQAGAIGYIEAAEGYAFTDKEGRFVLRLEPDRANAHLIVEHHGFEVFEEQYDQSTNLKILLQPFPHYRGVVVGPGDKPIDEVWVNGRRSKGGRFEVAIERPDDDGTIPIDITASGYRYLSESRLARPDLGVFHLLPLTQISGAVFGSDGGLVAAHVSMNSQPWISAGDGHFKIEIDPNDYPEGIPVSVRAVAADTDECADLSVDPMHAEGLVLRLAAGECPPVETPIEGYEGPPPEALQQECDDDEDE